MRAAKAAGYENAGTMEFLLDEERELLFYGNEHPDPGGASGNRVGDRDGSGKGTDPYRCRGSRFPIPRTRCISSGHAIECRINAENPAKGFRACPGDRFRICICRGARGSGLIPLFTAAIPIPPYYDSMMAKLIVHGQRTGRKPSRKMQQRPGRADHRGNRHQRGLSSYEMRAAIRSYRAGEQYDIEFLFEKMYRADREVKMKL